MGIPQRIVLEARDIFDTPDDGNRYEVIEGTMYVTPPPVVAHQHIVSRIDRKIWNQVAKLKLGVGYIAPCGVILSDGTGVQPDAFFIAADRVTELERRDAIYGAPDLVIEVLSPSTSKRDQTTKLEAYATSGVRECWLVSPEAENITLFALTTQSREVIGIVRGDDPIPTRVLAGVSILARELFED